MGADTVSGAQFGKIIMAIGIGGAAFRRRGEAYRATSFRSSSGSRGSLGLQCLSSALPVHWRDRPMMVGTFRVQFTRQQNVAVGLPNGSRLTAIVTPKWARHHDLPTDGKRDVDRPAPLRICGVDRLRHIVGFVAAVL